MIEAVQYERIRSLFYRDYPLRVFTFYKGSLKNRQLTFSVLNTGTVEILILSKRGLRSQGALDVFWRPPSILEEVFLSLLVF